MKALVLTNHLTEFSGSEIVALEVAAEFRDAGCEVVIVAGYVNELLRTELLKLGIPFFLADDFNESTNFDVIWSQHHLLPYLISKHGSSIISNSYVVSVSLSAFHPLEVPGIVADVADIILGNSLETAKRLTELGIHADRVKVFYNAAPSSFLKEHNSSETLGRLLIISNHAPQEVLAATEILRSRGIIVDHIGKPNNQERITPAIIRNYDAILTIGKSVQYAILSSTPVYVYDHFGGPGWLSVENFAASEYFNFSGRCCNRILSGNKIADEITNNYSEASEAIQVIKDRHLSKYLLHNLIAEILSLAKRRPPRNLDRGTSSLLTREGAICGELVNHLRLTYMQSELIKRLEAANTDIQDANTKQLKVIEQLEEGAKRLSKELTLVKRDVQLMHDSTSWKMTKPFRFLKRLLTRVQDFN